MKGLGTTAKNEYVLVVGDRNVARYKQGYTDQGRGKENYLFCILKKIRQDQESLSPVFFPFLSLEEYITMRKNHKAKRI